MIKRLFAVFILIAVMLSTFAMPVLADDDKELKRGDKFVIDKGVVTEYLGKNTDGTYNWKATIGAPQYLDDLVTPIDSSWNYDIDKKQWESRANLYQATVKDNKVTVIYKGKAMSWQPGVFIGTKKQATNPMADLLFDDPINENYHGNTLQWTYPEGITRNLRIIEGMLIEYYTIPAMPSADIVIDPKTIKDIDFIWTRPSVAWDADYEPVALQSDDAGVLTLTYDTMKLAKFPLTIDPDTSFTTSSSDGYLQYIDASYSIARTASTAETLSASSTSLALGQDKATTYGIYRVYLYFNDTSNLPDGATITAGTLKLYGYKDGSNTDFNMQIQSGMPSYPSDPLVKADYNYSYYSGDGGNLSTAGFTTSGYNSITLSATGRGWINKTGVTKFCIRSSRDINGNTPSGDEYVGVYSYEKGEGYRPVLEVTYTATAAPTITTDAASSVAKTTARLNSTLVNDGGGFCRSRFGYGTTTQATIAAYDEQTAWTGYVYSSGEHPFKDIGSLVADTEYFFRVEMQNDAGTTLGAELTFTTISDIGNPTNLRAYPSDTSVSLSWTKGTGTTNSMLRYKVGSYPTDETDGLQAYFGTSASTNHTGLERGKTYYYSVWGESGGGYSADSSDVMITTLAAGVSGEGLPTPTEPTRWMAAPNYENLENLPIVYKAVNDAADTIDMPRPTAWLFFALTLAVGVGIFFYTISKKAFVGLIVMTLALIFGWAIEIIPFWIPMLSAISVIAILWTQRREAY